MTNPVQKNQNVFLNQNTPISEAKNPHIQHQFKDTLYVRQSSPFNFSLKSFFDTITDFFKTLFGCCKGRNTQIPNLQFQIAEIARNKQFIWFYKERENPLTAFLGNFHPCPIELWGMRFQCAEAAYQAAKFAPNRDLLNRFAHLDGERAFNLGRQLFSQLFPYDQQQWHSRKVDIMEEVVKAKFKQNPDLKELLLATGSAYLVEHNPRKGRDNFWSDDHDGTGQNMLGRILMQQRAQLGGFGIAPRPAQYDQFLRR